MVERKPKNKTNFNDLQKTNVEAHSNVIQKVMFKNVVYDVLTVNKKQFIATPEGNFIYTKVHMFRMKDEEHPTLVSRYNNVYFSLEKLASLNSLDGLYMHAIFDSDIGRLYEIAHKLFSTTRDAEAKRIFPGIEVIDQSMPDYQAGSGYMVIKGKFDFSKNNSLTNEMIKSSGVVKTAK